MNLRPLGSTGLHVSEIGFGCWQLGGVGWGKVSARDAKAAILRALEAGVNLFDTAPIYGFGRSEELLGETLRAAGREALVVSKGGLVWDDHKRVLHDNRPLSLRRQLEDSLRRLGRDAIDVYLLHWPDSAVPLAESAAALESLRGEGKLRAWGLSNFPAAEVVALGVPGVRGLVLEHPLNWLGQYAAEYQASAAAGAELLDLSCRGKWGFLAFDVLARGLLGGRYDEKTAFGKRDLRSRDARFAGGAFEVNLARARKLAALARELEVSPAALAARAVLSKAGISACIVGMKSPTQVDELVRSSSLRLSSETRAQLEAV
jgi:aryl-alcohol dehydrogenase-like predicted oxidoreductase